MTDSDAGEARRKGLSASGRGPSQRAALHRKIAGLFKFLIDRGLEGVAPSREGGPAFFASDAEFLLAGAGIGSVEDLVGLLAGTRQLELHGLRALERTLRMQLTEAYPEHRELLDQTAGRGAG